jgi:hypothetical protein
MRVLYISGGQTHDYLCDTLFHGLRTILGPDCVDVNEMDFMYQGTARGGYTVWGLLPLLPIDRTDIAAKIAANYFDLVVYGSIHRCSLYWDIVAPLYHPSRLFLIDGEDDYTIASSFGAGLYFKREIPDDPAYASMLPIQFGVPREKIVDAVPTKTHVMAPLIPGDFSTYGYTTEESYREMYALSRFGRTRKKGGWDCMRHYEILMMGAVPYFEGLEACPSRTLCVLPKAELLLARHIFDSWSAERENEWLDVANHLLSFTREHLTTEALARRVLDRAVLARSA